MMRGISAGLIGLALAAGAIFGGSSGASAGERLRDRIYADSYGNLVIYSRAGYKRIIVGQGHLAEELAGYSDAGDEPSVITADGDDGGYWRDCYRPPVLIKGRSYMYGLADGELPQPAGSCHDR